MAGDIDRTLFQQALDELRFEDAEHMLGVGEGEELRSHLLEQRDSAEQRALELYQRLSDLADSGDHSQILRVEEDPSTAPLLALLGPTSRDRAELFIRNAARWQDAQRHTARRRLGDARKALSGLDLQLARGLLARVDNRYLNVDEVVEKDGLLLELSARSMELESLQETSEQLIEESQPRRRRWWRRDD